MSTIVVTGAAGFIGSHTCDRLLAEGHRVVAVDNFCTGKRENAASALKNPAYQLIEADVADSGVLERIAADAAADAIIHLAALVSVPQSIDEPALNFRLNLQATFEVVQAARALARRRGDTRPRVVFASSAAVYGDNPELPLSERIAARPISPYGAAKLASEALLLGHGASDGFNVRCLRYFNVFGPRQDPTSSYSGVISIFADRLRARQTVKIFGDGEQTRDFISVHDVARVNALAATLPGLGDGVTNICTGTPTSLNHLGGVMRKYLTGAPEPVHAAARPGDIRHSRGAPDLARAELGFSAEISLENGLRELLAAT